MATQSVYPEKCGSLGDEWAGSTDQISKDILGEAAEIVHCPCKSYSWQRYEQSPQTGAGSNTLSPESHHDSAPGSLALEWQCLLLEKTGLKRTWRSSRQQSHPAVRTTTVYPCPAVYRGSK